MRTIGISPKVLIPAVAQIVAGVVFLLLGNDVEGKTAIATGLGTLLVGYQAPAAPVTHAAELPGGITDEQRAALVPKRRARKSQ